MDLIEQKKINSIKFKRHPWETVRLKLLLFLLKKITNKNFIVDVGSGDAFIAMQLAQGFPASTVVAVDINYDDEFIKENDKRHLRFLKCINDVPDTNPVNAILLMDVLEHIQKPEELLNDIKQLKNVSSSTQFIITVPAFQSLFCDHDIFLKHYRRYNRKELNKLVAEAGFQVDFDGYFFITLFPARVFQKTFDIKAKHGLHDWKGNRLATSIASIILWIDFKISWYLSRTGIHLPGLSCYCVCHPLPS